MQCSEIITRDIEWVTPEEPIYKAASLMREHDIGFIPVCDADRRVLGTLTDRDITVRLVADQRTSDTAVRDIMTPDAVACREHDDLHAAESLMQKNHVSRLVCLDSEDKLVGVVSLADVARRDDAQHVHSTMQNIKSDAHPPSLS